MVCDGGYIRLRRLNIIYHLHNIDGLFGSPFAGDHQYYLRGPRVKLTNQEDYAVGLQHIEEMASPLRLWLVYAGFGLHRLRVSAGLGLPGLPV